MRARLSLKGRALQLLAQRDQSRLELRRKLLQQLRKEASAALAIERGTGGRVRGPVHDGGDAEGTPSEPDPGSSEKQVEALLDWLESHRYLSNERFAEARVHARERRFGNLRIRSELAQHGLALEPEAARALSESEVARAQAVRERRFASVPATASERAAQARFLAARGFSPEAIQRALRAVLRR